ncbi:hypothetical protein PHYPO_G00209350 [Pangasianodon hypophthalmus]|uniref:C1q domain-containing protein n=1 Tax=Pangasianodon hypophthalmus TaxID=310915 RepID=A0A5N5PCS0_PANHP|nr:hypothetical protein PHYPO_G00209350 [Pangasianodon hypophthalmus]
MRALVFLAFSLYQCTVVQGADVDSPEVHLGPGDHSFISRIVSELREVKSILKEALKQQGQTHGNTCSAEIRYELNELKSTVADQKVKLEALQKQLADKPNVAFSASLFLPQRPTTGKFTAPVKGVYYFGFSAFATGQYSMGVHLRKNGEQVVATYDYNSSHKDVNGANRAVLILEKGDEVYIGLWSGLHIFDSYNRVSTFTGFLIFPM